MQFTTIALAALAGLASAQNMTLNQTLISNNLTGLAGFLGQVPQVATALSQATNFTLLAPSNAVFAALASPNNTVGAALLANPSSWGPLLQYHLLQGMYYASQFTNRSAFVPTALMNTSYTNVTGGQRVQGVLAGGNVNIFSGLLQNVTVTRANINTTGGVIHEINGALTIPLNVSTTAIAANLTSLAGALNATNLTNTVNTARDVTIFAPNNAAFQSIGSALANLSTTQLASILQYHVVQGTVGYSTTLMNNSNISALSGGQLRITQQGSSIFVNGARVVQPDVLVANGVVHVIDNVLNPNNTSAAPTASATSGMGQFSGASSATNVPFTSGVPTPSTTIASGAGAGATSRAASGSAAASSTKTGAAAMPTGAIGAAALFGAGAALLNYQVL